MRVIIVAVYMGPLPSNMQLWLESCRRNQTFDWLLVTDQDVTSYKIPRNVNVSRLSLMSLKDRFSKECGFEVSLTTPYKLNDFKPLYFTLIGNLSEYAYWGFCDIDLIFGDLKRFIAKDAWQHDMLFSEGHFRLFRNDPFVNGRYRLLAGPRSWKNILKDPSNIGMDEHQGINKVYSENRFSHYENRSIIADIDPSFRQLRLVPQCRNYLIQCFFYQDGEVGRVFWHGGKIGTENFMYLHHQKRSLSIDRSLKDYGAVWITQQGFIPLSGMAQTRASINHLNPWYMPNVREVERVIRMKIRRWLRPNELYASIASR